MPEPPNKNIVLLTFNLFDTVYCLVRGSVIFITVILNIISTVIVVIIDVYVNDKKYSVFVSCVYVDFNLYTETLRQCDNAR